MPGRSPIPTSPSSPGELDLPAYVAELEPDLAHLSVDELKGLREVALEAQTVLDTVGRVCLVHSDLNPKNLLLDPSTLELAAVLDWEYAHAGHPFTDLGNLLRFERDPRFTGAVLTAYAARRGTPPEEALPLARAADLFALAELADSQEPEPGRGPRRPPAEGDRRDPRRGSGRFGLTRLSSRPGPRSPGCR